MPTNTEVPSANETNTNGRLTAKCIVGDAKVLPSEPEQSAIEPDGH
jgi:hypothetical protein